MSEDNEINLNDIITINVGGKIFQTRRITLMSSVPVIGDAHFFAPLVSGKFKLPKGTIFLDRDPTYFQYILNYLRVGGNVRKVVLPKDEDAKKSLALEAEFYSLSHLQYVLEGLNKLQVYAIKPNVSNPRSPIESVLIDEHEKFDDLITFRSKRIGSSKLVSILKEGRVNLVTFEFYDAYCNVGAPGERFCKALEAYIDKGGSVLCTHDVLDYKKKVPPSLLKKFGLKITKSSLSYPFRSEITVLKKHQIFEYPFDLTKISKAKVALTHSGYSGILDGKCLIKLKSGDHYLVIKENKKGPYGSGRCAYIAAGHSTAFSDFERMLFVNLFYWLLGLKKESSKKEKTEFSSILDE